MKRFYLRFRIILMTLALGLASVNFFNWLNDYWGDVYVELPQVESASVIEVITKRNNGRFEITRSVGGGTNGYGGRGSAIGYLTDDWQRLLVETSCQSSSKKAKREVEARIKEAVKVLDDTKYFNKKSKFQERRVVLENEYQEKKWIDILKYDGSRLIKIISATSLDLALELEQTLKTEE